MWLTPDFENLAPGHPYVANRKITLKRINLVIPGIWDGYQQNGVVILPY